MNLFLLGTDLFRIILIYNMSDKEVCPSTKWTKSLLRQPGEETFVMVVRFALTVAAHNYCGVFQLSLSCSHQVSEHVMVVGMRGVKVQLLQANNASLFCQMRIFMNMVFIY